MRSLSVKSQRGVTAVEFALVVPWFLVLCAIMITFGRGFWTEFLILNIASATTRTCVQNQYAASGTSSGKMVSCVKETGNKLISSYTNLCPGAQVNVSTDTPEYLTASNVVNSTAQICLLDFTIQCNMPMLFFIPASWGNIQIPLVARSTMPYLN